MSMLRKVAGFSGLEWGERSAVLVLSFALLFATCPLSVSAAQDPGAPPPQDQAAPQGQTPQGPPYNTQTPEQLQQLVAPIALYPDSLVAQILAASTFPEQIVEADRWVQANPDLKGDALGQAVDKMPWDPSVKALAAFPTVLGNMDKNLSWTSSLGDAYYNQQQDVMDAVQVMRQKAEQSGNLKTTPQQTVTTQGSTIIIQPAAADVVYVPAYNPWLVYGGPIVAWPGWYPYPGIWYGGPYLSFGIGFGIGFFGGYGWGWPHWGFNWHNHYVVYNNGRYYSHSTTFYNRNAYYRGGHGGPSAPGRGFSGDRYAGTHGNVYNRPGASPRPFEGDRNAARGYAEPHEQPHAQSNVKSGAFSGYDHGGESRSYSARGESSFHGGGGGGGGGSHGGGGGGHH
ncbi:MAG TPA: DUF3300 domain-containing protein [Candidatus Acidoferrales bacterium]|jgi:hypothetical protein|nr:DUF3300 domain-containing protein [Candidatus Acidoferrales bacterium]